MQQWIYGIMGVVVVGVGIGLYESRQKSPAVSPAQTVSESSASEAVSAEQPGNAGAARQPSPRPTRVPAGNPPAEQADTRPEIAVAKATPPASIGFKLAVDTLVSAQSSYPDKEAAWKQLRDSGKLDQAIADLEQRATANPQAAEYSATLGRAYLEKAGTLKDVREQGILGMKADMTFEAALQVDPSNWEARFTKAVAMSYWPPQLNKGQEVIANFTQLINQQEAQPPQPQYAQSYVWLGDQYQKAGNSEYARQVWQRGAALYPNDATLPQRLTQPAGK